MVGRGRSPARDNQDLAEPCHRSDRERFWPSVVSISNFPCRITTNCRRRTGFSSMARTGLSGRLKHLGARICPGVRLVSPLPSGGPEIRRRTSEEGAGSLGVGAR